MSQTRQKERSPMLKLIGAVITLWILSSIGISGCLSWMARTHGALDAEITDWYARNRPPHALPHLRLEYPRKKTRRLPDGYQKPAQPAQRAPQEPEPAGAQWL